MGLTLKHIFRDSIIYNVPYRERKVNNYPATFGLLLRSCHEGTGLIPLLERGVPKWSQESPFFNLYSDKFGDLGVKSCGTGMIFTR